MVDYESSDDGMETRSAEEVAQRVLALLVVIGKVHDPEGSLAWMRQHNLQAFLSPAEVAFVNKKSPSEGLRVSFSWRAESAVSLLWALSALSEMPPLNLQCNIFEIEAVREALKNPSAFIATAQLRDLLEVSDMESNLLHQHWRVRDEQLGGVGKLLEPDPGDPPIEALNPGIVYERRYAMSWLVGHGNDWDNVPTDT